MKRIHELDATPEACARELARRLREGIRDESTIEAAACALESMAFCTSGVVVCSVGRWTWYGGGSHDGGTVRERTWRRYGDLVSVSPSREISPTHHKWLVAWLGNDYGDSIVLRQHTEEGKRYSFSLWSANHEFSISFHPPTNSKDRGYIGAGMTNRAPWVGEQHRRGGDLYDGSFNEETWQGVMRDVVRQSLLRVVPDPVHIHRKRRVRKSRPKKSVVTVVRVRKS